MPPLARPLAAALLLATFSTSPWAQTAPTAPLNDTGQAQCYNGSSMVACTRANTGNDADYPGQDGRYGRDAAASATPPALTKTGGGSAGFDFTALDSSGAVTTTLGSHHCVQDNVTGLIWSTETLQLQWAEVETAANIYSRCGKTDGWRLPTLRELLSIVDYGRSSPAIDTGYFPNTTFSPYTDPDNPAIYWTADEYKPSTVLAWTVDFYTGLTDAWNKTLSLPVHLVRSAP